MEHSFLTENVQEHIVALIDLANTTETYSALKEIEKLEKIKSYYSKLVAGITTEINQIKSKELKSQVSGGDNNQLIMKFPDTSFIEPRGRVDVSLYGHGLSIEGKVMKTFIRWTDISHIIRIPSSVSTKKEGEEILIIRVGKPFTIGNREHHHILWSLSNTPAKTDSTVESDTVTIIVSDCCKSKITGVNKSIFQSVSKQRSYLRCYKGIQEGSIYPLKCGLVFVKPLVFLPVDEITSINVGRGGATGGTKYVDLVVTTLDGKTIEFTNIDREELPSLQIYIKGYLEAHVWRKAAVSVIGDANPGHGTATSHAGTCFDENEDSDDEDDEDFDPDECDDEEIEAQQGSDDDDDENYDDETVDEDEDNYKPKYNSGNRSASANISLKKTSCSSPSSSAQTSKKHKIETNMKKESARKPLGIPSSKKVTVKSEKTQVISIDQLSNQAKVIDGAKYIKQEIYSHNTNLSHTIELHEPQSSAVINITEDKPLEYDSTSSDARANVRSSCSIENSSSSSNTPAAKKLKSERVEEAAELTDDIPSAEVVITIE